MIRAKKPWSVAAAAAILLGIGVVSFGFGMRSQSLGNPLDPPKTPDEPIAKSVVDAKAAGEQAKKKLTESNTNKDTILKTTGDLKSLVGGKDERSNWILLNEVISKCLPLPDGS